MRLTGAYEDSDTFRDQGFIERRSITPSISIKLSSDTKLLLQGTMEAKAIVVASKG